MNFISKGIAGLVLGSAIAGAGCATTPYARKYDDHVLFERRAHGTQSIDIKVTEGNGSPYCTNAVYGIDCEFPVGFLLSPQYNFMGMSEAKSACWEGLRFTRRVTRLDLQACAYELMSINMRELAPGSKEE